MPQPVEVRTPVATGDAEKVGRRLWRKQVLPIGDFQIGSRHLKVTPDYCRQVASAFADEAYDTVPTMLADKTNDHTMAVLDEGGQVLALDTEDDGLYATVQLSEPVNERVEANKRLGVSVRIRENYDRSDGKYYPAAMQHLLLTWDPRIPSMRPWEPIDLSNPVDDVLVIDLSAATYESTTPTEEGRPTMADLTPDELAQVRAVLPLLERLQESGQDTAPPAEGEPTDEDLDAEYARIAQEIFGDLDDEEDGDTDSATETATGPGGGDGDDQDDDKDDRDDDGDGDGSHRRPADQADTGQPAEQVAASNTGGDYLELSNAARAEDRSRILELSNQLDEANYEREREQLVRATGLPPSIIELARPVLQGSRHVVELSNGSEVDAGEVMRKVLAAVGEKVQLLDLSAAIGTDEPTDEDKQAAERRRSLADDILANY